MRHLVFVLLFISFLAKAQKSDQEYLLDYKKGVQRYASHDFEGAIAILTPLTGAQYTNVIVPYSLYYYALASLELNKTFQARAILRELFQRNISWDKMDEAYYLYALVNFKDKYFDEGVSYLDRISSSEFKDDKEALMQNYIPAIENIISLKELNQKFPAKRIIAETLLNKIQARKYNTKADLELSDVLTDRFKLVSPENIESEKSNIGFGRPYDDKEIDFGVLLPFDLTNFDVKEATSKNRYVYDMYSGMLLAMDVIKEENISVNLFGFDVGSSSESAVKYLKDQNFKKLDALIGPLYGRPNKIVGEFAEANKMFQIHPISNSQSLITDTKNSFLVQASENVQAQKCLDFAEKMTRIKSVSIYFESDRDSLFASIYAKEAKKRGYTISEFKAYKRDGLISKVPQKGHIFVIGGSSFGPDILRMLGQNKSDSLVIATESSFNSETVSRSTLNKNLYLINPRHVDLESESLKEFKRKYIAKMNMYPSYYSFLGYDMLLFYSRMLKNGKEIFRLNLDESPFMGDLLLSGFDYSNKSAENKIVPIVKYNNGRFEIMNMDER